MIENFLLSICLLICYWYHFRHRHFRDELYQRYEPPLRMNSLVNKINNNQCNQNKYTNQQQHNPPAKNPSSSNISTITTPVICTDSSTSTSKSLSSKNNNNINNNDDNNTVSSPIGNYKYIYFNDYEKVEKFFF